MTIGVLYPSSDKYPAIGSDFVDGIKVLLRQEGLSATVELKLEGIRFGGAEKEVYDKAEKLLRMEKADVLIAYVDLRVLPILEPLTYSLDKLLIVVNPGANYPANWVPQLGTLYITLQHAFWCYLTGMLAANPLPAQATVATSFYDCGYLHTAAMANGFAQQGGDITYNFVHPQSYESFDISPLSGFLEINPATDHLLCIYDELPARLFYEKIAATPKLVDLQLFASPMMLEGAALALLQEGASFSVQGYRPWVPEADNEANQSFSSAYQAVAKKAPSLFALLGWEVGQLLQQVIQDNGDVEFSGEKTVEQLKKGSWQSPRGIVQIDEDTHYLLAPAAHYTIRNGEVDIQEMTVASVREQWSQFSNTPAAGVVSGWTNTYLCY